MIKSIDFYFASTSASYVNDLLIKEKKKGFLGIGKKYEVMTKKGLIECSGSDVELYRVVLFLCTRSELTKI